MVNFNPKHELVLDEMLLGFPHVRLGGCENSDIPAASLDPARGGGWAQTCAHPLFKCGGGKY